MYESFRNILSIHLSGKKWKKHYPIIVFNLIALNEGHRPSFLWDIGPSVDLQVLNGFIKHLKHESLLKNSISLLVFNSEIFIADLEILFRYLNDSSSSIVFVDCSCATDEPAVIEAGSGLHKGILNDIQLIKENIFVILEKAKKDCDCYNEVIKLSVEVSGHELFCPVTIFGILLGYPVVYWSKNILNGNCLSFIKLSVFEVKVTFLSSEFIKSNSYFYNLYSFSVPNVFNLDGFIDSWFTSLKDSDVLKFKLCKKVVSLPSIQL